MSWIYIGFFIVGIGALYGFFVWHKVERSIEISKPIIAATKPYEQHPASPQLRILIAGDSIGVGVGSIKSGDSLAGRIGQDFPAADITNIAASGARLEGLEKALGAHEHSGYDIVVIVIGGNDITHNTSFADIRNTLQKVMIEAEHKGKRIIVLTAGNVGLCPAFKWPLSSLITYRTREVRKIFIEEIAKHPQASYIDLFNEREDEIFNTDIPRYYAPDLFHPSGDGYGVWYSKLKPLI